MLGIVRKKNNFRKQYDEFLLNSIDRAKSNWDHARETEEAISETDGEITSQTQLARQKYLFLYQEARVRDVRNNHFQSSVFDY
ncbi:YaaL family protein [Apilactobacillus ozensis]|uniref:DUF2508 domain-containing protein n=1 Tax=Apilactobacillus ozensis DSM 23829 = JCM 17196 TaxID=1423781 RepID=A0A0R2AS29_9LACO|nr:YaaL family protein [Apilactobacillus ozensis]KRM69455.1 hypothetical protein FD06_GL001125 [Apilactobacillus ozensis DSM 23829 = JCM 17196]MCK8607603.1 YaaL family protein [Apilactobacillus ozensis]